MRQQQARQELPSETADATEMLAAAYASAAAAGHEAHLELTVAGRRVGIQAADTPLLEILGRALRQLETGSAAGTAELTISVWDSAAELPRRRSCPRPIPTARAEPSSTRSSTACRSPTSRGSGS